MRLLRSLFILSSLTAYGDILTDQLTVKQFPQNYTINDMNEHGDVCGVTVAYLNSDGHYETRGFVWLFNEDAPRWLTVPQDALLAVPHCLNNMGDVGGYVYKVCDFCGASGNEVYYQGVVWHRDGTLTNAPYRRITPQLPPENQPYWYGGGSWHHVGSVVQGISDNGNIAVQMLPTWPGEWIPWGINLEGVENGSFSGQSQGICMEVSDSPGPDGLNSFHNMEVLPLDLNGDGFPDPANANLSHPGLMTATATSMSNPTPYGTFVTVQATVMPNYNPVPVCVREYYDETGEESFSSTLMAGCGYIWDINDSYIMAGSECTIRLATPQDTWGLINAAGVMLHMECDAVIWDTFPSQKRILTGYVDAKRVNNRGMILAVAGNGAAGCFGNTICGGQYAILYSPGIPGDMNEDGVVNNFDIDLFINCIVYDAGEHCELADVNQDGRRDNFDIDAFVNLILSQ